MNPRPRWPRLVALVLATLWLGGNGVIGFTAGMIFRHTRGEHGALYSRDVAGTVFGSILLPWTHLVWFLAVPAAACAIIAARRRLLAAAIAAILLALHGWNCLAGHAVLDQRARRDAASEPTARDAAQARFDVLHKRSELAAQIETWAVLAAVLALAIRAGQRVENSRNAASKPVPAA